ncbi:uncharacterized protein LOC143179606 [Calliopsis andreniformis]|uniref:uncharacterized protein LOC143179606 n=1 Tax=Calliopsis andreniformis TaxID=337506 RepID=UPI003FCE41FF
MTSSLEQEEQIFQKARKEQEANYQENQKAKKEREDRLRKELQDYYSEAAVTRSVQLQEQKDLKAWEMMHRFKKAEQDKELEIEEQKRKWNEKMEYATALKQYMVRELSKHMIAYEKAYESICLKLKIENDAKREEERILADDTILTKEIIEKENQRVLTYAEEVLNESTGVRPLYPIVKAIQVCKKEMGLQPLKKRDEVVTDTVPKRRRRGPLKCTKFVPEDKILYL